MRLLLLLPLFDTVKTVGFETTLLVNLEKWMKQLYKNKSRRAEMEQEKSLVDYLDK